MLLLAAVTALFAANDEVVFRSDVTLVRVDAQVVDRDNRTIMGLAREDFVLREGGRTREIRNFVTEDMPVDVLLLLDVSGSMRPNIERVARASRTALRVLGKDDRVGVMVFDRSTRVRSPFRNNPADVQRELDRVIDHEGFNGGTDITRALGDAVRYISRQGRKEARRAIVIVTDDETEFDRDENRLIRELARADTVLSALIAPVMMHGYPGGGRRRSTGWPGGGWPGGGPVIIGPGGGGGSRTQPAGTDIIARESGGDSMRVEDASALQTTLERIRQRYALHFLVSPGAKAGEQRTIGIDLAPHARRRHPDAEVRYRRTYVSPTDTGTAPVAEPEPSSTPVTVLPAEVPRQIPAEDANPVRRRPARQERQGPGGPGIGTSSTGEIAPAPPPTPQSNGRWRRVTEPEPVPEPVDPDRPVLKRKP